MRGHHLLLECAYEGQARCKTQQEEQEENVKKLIK
jgi:hypothetical protein